MQMHDLNIMAHNMLTEKMTFPPKWSDMGELESSTNAWFYEWRSTRQELARKKGGWTRTKETIDRLLRTDKIEYLDDPNCGIDRKVRIVKGVHMFNVLNRSYPLFARTLKPLIEDVFDKQKRPVRLLELASGSGEQALSLASIATRTNLPVEITGSDYIPKYVERANELAKKRNIKAEFRVINAFDMKNVNDGEFDIILICGSTHHFSTGQVAMMIAQSKRVATSCFVSIDGRRGIDNLLGVVPLPLVTLQFSLLHDAWLSGRKFYSQYELESMAQIASPGASIRTQYIGPAKILGCMIVSFHQENGC